MKEGVCKKAGTAIAAIIVVSLYPCLFLFFQNAGEANLADVIPSALRFIGVFTALGAVLFFAYRDVSKAAVETVAVELAFLNFALIEKLMNRVFPALFYWHILFILLILLVIIGIVIRVALKPETAFFTTAIIVSVFGVLILLNGAMAVPTLAEKLSGHSTASGVELAGVSNGDDRPNVYLMIFDEYGGYRCLQEYCHFQNDVFFDQMAELGFHASRESYGNTISTDTAIPNLMNLDYVVDDAMLISEKDKKLIDPAIYQIFRSNGYEINAAGGMIDTVHCEYSYRGETTKEFSAERYIIQNTAAYPFYTAVQTSDFEMLSEHLRYVTDSSHIKDSGLFTVSYYCCPHLPWFMDENGQSIDAARRENWLDRSVYLGQLKYLSGMIVDMMREIIRNDPDSVIVLMSDHGYRVVEETRSLYGIDTGEDEIYQKNILNMVYFRGQEIDIEGLTPIDTMRLVLNRTLHTELKMLGARE